MTQRDIERIGSATGRRPLYGIAATRRIEAAALSAEAPFAPMARAGEAAARLALAVAPHARRVVVFAGAGNNGGDGIEAAHQLHAFGKDVRVVLVGDPGALPADAAEARARARAAGVAIDLAPEGRLGSAGDGAELVIDALLGLGASRPVGGALAAAVARIAALRAGGARVLSIDGPTGLDAERGRPTGAACVTADDTLGLLTLKPGFFTAAGRDHVGRVWLASLGVAAGDAASPDAWLVGTGDAACLEAPRRHAQHKGSFGDVAVVGGAPGMEGAASLAARAAHAAGAGRVFVELVGRGASAGSVLDAMRPELMWRPGWSAGDAATVAAAVVVCGCGGGDAVRAVLPRLLSVAKRLVIDADALNAIAADTALQAMLAARHGRGFASVLTPHPLEAARLLGSDAHGVQADRLGAACALAERFRAVVVLKGSGSVIAAPAETPRINATGNASLAGAGTGDVLAGWIGGRWAATASLDPAHAFDVATRGVIEHGAAAEPERPGSLRAGDLIDALHHRSRT